MDPGGMLPSFRGEARCGSVARSHLVGDDCCRKGLESRSPRRSFERRKHGSERGFSPEEVVAEVNESTFCGAICCVGGVFGFEEPFADRPKVASGGEVL